MGRHVSSIALCLVLVTAGCAGFAGQPEESATAEPVEYGPVPGVPAVDEGETARVSVDASQVLAANRRARANTTYTVERTVTVQGPNGTVRFERTRQVGRNGTLERLSITDDDPFTAVVDSGTFWTNGTASYARTNLSNGRTTVGKRIRSQPRPYGYGTALPERVLSAGEYQANRTADGVVLQSAQVDVRGDGLIPIRTGPPSDERVRITVAESGLVTGIILQYEATQGGQQVTVVVRHRLVDVGETSVRRPAWVAVAD